MRRGWQRGVFGTEYTYEYGVRDGMSRSSFPRTLRTASYLSRLEKTSALGREELQGVQPRDILDHGRRGVRLPLVIPLESVEDRVRTRAVGRPVLAVCGQVSFNERMQHPRTVPETSCFPSA